MWKKQFIQDGTLTQHIQQYQESEPDYDNTQEYISPLDESQPAHEYIEDVESDETDDWDPFEPNCEWTTQKLTDFILGNPYKLPNLHRIVQFQANPYNSISFYLCEFNVNEKFYEIWLSESVLFHTEEYKKKLVTEELFQKNSLAQFT